MFFLRCRKIIGILTVITLLLIQVPQAYALYSPRLNKEATTIIKHIYDARQAHGTGKWMDLFDKSAAIEPNEGYQATFLNTIKEMTSDALTDNFWDGLSLLAKSWIDTFTEKKGISNCLRDDIWELQALKEQVLNELLKTSAMSDYTRSNLLWRDYQFLDLRISGDVGEGKVGVDWDGDGKVSPSENSYYNLKHRYSESSFWFPDSQNFYLECPYGDFIQAWEDIKRAFDSFKALGSGTIQLGSFGAMAEAAKERAIKRAAKWIKANQITLTIGGKEGSSPRSLVNGPGLKGLAADFKTETTYAKNYGSMVYENTKDALLGLQWTDKEKSDYQKEQLKLKPIDIGTYADAYISALDAKKKAEKEMTTAIKYNLSLNNVAENSLKAIDAVLSSTNSTIRDAVSKEAVPQNLSTFCEEFSTLLKIQCKNKSGGDVPTCK